MFAIAFDLTINDLRATYGEPYTFRVEDWSDFTPFVKEEAFSKGY